jgi:hypothetical protein
MTDNPERKTMHYPMKITFKAIFRNGPTQIERIRGILTQNGIEPAITGNPSRYGTFISFTVSAVFPSDEVVDLVCGEITRIDGYMSMF